jgi:outer membrane protein assembly factor BamB
MRARRIISLPALAALAALVLLVVGILVLKGGSSKESRVATDSGYPNFNLSNTRYTGGPIDQKSVSRLKVAWTLPLTAKSQYGSYSSSPIISAGVIYSQDLSSNVQAIDVRTGRALWTRSYESPDQGPNGLVVAGGEVYGATATSAFALDARTGRQIWSVNLVRNPHEGIDMAPGYHNGIVYVSTVPGNNALFYGGRGIGVLWALDGATGRRLWHFDTLASDPQSARHADINSGGGLWYTPAFDDQGFMYIGVGNPAPFPGTGRYPWGSSRPGPNLYTDSLVKLDATTGRLQWYYQLTPHDLYDHDLQDPPILVDVKGRQMVIAAGKAGIVIGIDSRSGKLLWRRAVGIHNGHDNDSIYAMKREYSKLHLPETVYPGLLGGVIAPMATNGSTVFVPVVNLPVTYTTQTVNQEGPSESGELVALDTATGAVRWTHKFSEPAFGAATAVNDLVLATAFGGKLYAFAADTGSVLWERQLPAATNTGVAVNGDTLLAPAGVAAAPGQSTQLVAYRIGGGGAE